MKKLRLLFLCTVLLAGLFFISCAGSSGTSADEDVPVVEAIPESYEVQLPPPDEPAFVPDEPAPDMPESVPEETGFEQDAVQEPDDVPEDDEIIIDEPCAILPHEDISVIEETLSGEDESEFISDETALSESEENLAAETDQEDYSYGYVYTENEFIPFVEEPVYILDVENYYDGFSISDGDFVAVADEFPEEYPDADSEPADSGLDYPVLPELAAAQIPVETDLTETEDAAVSVDEVFPEKIVAFEELSSVMEQIYIPPVREDMKKPVVIVTEDEAAAVNEQEKEASLAEIENILAEIPEPEESPKPVPSRSVKVNRNDILEIPYQGNWWVYLGDENASGTMSFSGREYISENTVFTLRAVSEGEALLHFFKQDIIGDVIIDDYLAVTVENADKTSETVALDVFVISQLKPVPPEEDESVDGDDVSVYEAETDGTHVTDEAAILPAVENDAGKSVSSEQSAAIKSDDIRYVLHEDDDENNLTSSLYEEIPEETDVVSVETKQDKEKMSDAELFQKAQELEASDIEEALKLYKKLVADYPVSQYWTQANRRITYINRFYFFKR